MSRKQAARTRPGKAEVERKRDERAARRALARERRNRTQGEGEHDSGGGLNEQLRALGLRLREVPGDGNCLFRALGDQLEGHSRNHLKHRQDTVAYMIQQRPDFEPFVEDDVPFEKHIANLAQLGTFAGNDAIVAFARNNQVNIVIHQQNAPLWQIHGTDKSNARELHIAYRYGEHYDSVRKINDNSAAPAWLQMEMLCQNESPNQEAPQAKGERQQQPKEESQDKMDDALQKVHNATGCSDVGLIAQVLEAEDYRIESAIFAVFQMKDLEKLQEDQANRPNPQLRPAPWDEKGSRGSTLGRQEAENNNSPCGNLLERNRPGQKPERLSLRQSNPGSVSIGSTAGKGTTRPASPAGLSRVFSRCVQTQVGPPGPFPSSSRATNYAPPPCRPPQRSLTKRSSILLALVGGF